MKRIHRSPFQVLLPKEIWGDTTSRNEYPERWKYTISIATPIVTYTQIGPFVRQYFGLGDLYFELWSLSLNKDGYFDLSVKQPITTVGISLKNRLSVRSSLREWKTLRDKRYRILSIPKGKCKVKVFRGVTNFLFIVPPAYMFEILGNETLPELKKKSNTVSQIPLDILLTKECSVDITLKRTIKQLQQLKADDKKLTTDLFTYVIRIISHYAYSLKDGNDSRELSRSAMAAYDAKRYILQNLKEPGIGNVQHLCRMFGVSDKPLKREFEILTSLTIPAFVKEQRLQIGLKVSADPLLSVAEMAHIAGYSEVSNFIRDFKKRFGRTPKKESKNLSPSSPVIDNNNSGNR